MKKIYENPKLIALELYALDVITASINHSDLDKEDDEKSDDNAVFWAHLRVRPLYEKRL